MPPTPLRIFGAPGSPYSRKMRALLRYRRIPFHWGMRDSKEAASVPPVPVRLIPVLVFPGEGGSPDEAMIDSTFQIRRLEAHASKRSVVPPDPALAFVDALLEDYADEWLTKAMFHYRWAYQADIDKAAAVLPRWSRVNVPEEGVRRFSKAVRCCTQCVSMARRSSKRSTVRICSSPRSCSRVSYIVSAKASNISDIWSRSNR